MFLNLKDLLERIEGLERWQRERRNEDVLIGYGAPIVPAKAIELIMDYLKIEIHYKLPSHQEEYEVVKVGEDKHG